MWFDRSKPSAATRLYDLEASNGLLEDKLHALEISYALLLQDVATLKDQVAELQERRYSVANPWEHAAQFQRVEPLPPVPVYAVKKRVTHKKEAKS